MKHYDYDSDDDEDDEHDGHDNDEHDDEDFEEQNDATIPCPYCATPIPEDAPRCPYCENYVSREDSPPRRRSWFFVVCMLLALWAVFRMTF